MILKSTKIQINKGNETLTNKNFKSTKEKRNSTNKMEL